MSKEIVAEAKKRLKLAIDATGQNRADALDDLRFSYGDQWPGDMRRSRELEGRPCLTINKTDTFVRNVVNNMRQQRPRIKTHPVGDGADVQVSEVLEGLIRHIEYASNADVAYDTASDAQVRMGWGYLQVSARYVEQDSFDQELYIDPIRNAFGVYFDPSSTACDGSDADWCLITSRMRREVFKSTYPNADPVDWKQLGAGDEKALWANKEEITIAMYWRIEQKAEKLYLLSDGSKRFESEMPSDEVLAGAGITKVDERDSIKRQVRWSKITAKEVIEGYGLDDAGEWPGKYIPVVPVYGAEMVLDGKVTRYGMVRALKDPQQMYNFWRTSEAELVALAPKAPWLVAEGQIEGFEDTWNQANTRSYSFLPYKPMVDDNNTPVPPPQRQQPQAIPAASVNAAMAASEDMKAVAGMFDPALGAQGNETSGTMVNARQAQSDLSNFHFYDNLTHSIEFVGRILIDAIPHFYDTERTIRIIGEDGKADSTTINEKQRDESGAIQKVLNDLSVGRYDVVMDVGPGYQTKRQEGSEAMMQLVKGFPQIAEVGGDIIVRGMDFPGAQQLADRLAASNPIAQMEEKLPDDIAPEVKALLMHTQTQLQQAQQQLQELQQEKAAKVFGETARSQGETERLRMKEDGQDRRAHVSAITKVHDTETRSDRIRDDVQLKAYVELAKAHLDKLLPDLRPEVEGDMAAY